MRLQHLQTAQAQSKTQLEVAMKDTSAGGAEEVRTLKVQLQQAERQIVEARTEVEQEVQAMAMAMPPAVPLGQAGGHHDVAKPALPMQSSLQSSAASSLHSSPQGLAPASLHGLPAAAQAQLPPAAMAMAAAGGGDGMAGATAMATATSSMAAQQQQHSLAMEEQLARPAIYPDLRWRALPCGARAPCALRSHTTSSHGCAHHSTHRRGAAGCA